MDAGELPGYRMIIEGQYDTLFGDTTADAVRDEARTLAPYFDRVMVALAPPAHVRVLDVGCGSGAFALTVAWARRNGHVTGVDASTRAVTVAAAAARAGALPNVAFAQGDAEDPPAGPFDRVSALGVFNLVPEKARALAAWRRVAADDARLVLADGFRDAGASTRGAGALTAPDFEREAARAGWRVVAHDDLTPLVRVLHADRAWPWREYVRPGFRFLLWTLDAA